MAKAKKASAPKRSPTTKVPAGNVSTGKSSTNKASTNKASTNKASTNKASTKKSSTKTASTNKASTKKSSTKTASTKTASTKKPSAKKASANKASTRKASANKASTKKSSTKKPSAKTASAKTPSAKKPPAGKSSAAATNLVAKFVQQVNSRAEVEALSAADREQFIVAVGGIVGGKKLAAICKNLAELMMGVMKLQLFRGTTHAYDVWINTVVDDGSVMLPNSAKHSGIGISQTRVYGHDAPREDECAAIYQAIYKGGVKYPPFVEADWS